MVKNNRVKYPLLLVLLSINILINGQQLVVIKSSTGDTIYADQYLKSPDLPYIILIHKKEASRGEFGSIAENFFNLGYNCLVPDLRYGAKYNYVENLTAKAGADNFVGHDELLQDIESVIDFAWQKHNQQCLLLGSADGASLALLAARKNRKVQGVIALSPGEYFLPSLKVSESVKPYDKPVFIAVTKQDALYVQPIIDNIPGNLLMTSIHPFRENVKGSLLIISDQTASKNVWMDLLIYFSKLKKGGMYLN